MASRNCPVCGTTLKLENLARHIANVHPRENPSVVLSEEERTAGSRDARRAGPTFLVKRSTLAVIAIVLVSVVGVVFAIPYLPTPHGSMAMHWHPQVTITIDGQSMTIPANIGIDPAFWQDHSLDQNGMPGMAPLHTHDTTGTIHVESRELRDYTLGDFFRIWGQTFDAQQVLGHTAQAGHRVWMVVDGSTMSPSYSVVLRDQMRIQIVCGAG